MTFIQTRQEISDEAAGLMSRVQGAQGRKPAPRCTGSLSWAALFMCMAS